MSSDAARALQSLPSLRGRRVVLRRVQERDIEDRLAAGRDAEAVRMVRATKARHGYL